MLGCMYLCIQVYLHGGMLICICSFNVCACSYVLICASIYRYMYVNMYASMYVDICVFLYIYIYLSMHICMWVS